MNIFYLSKDPKEAAQYHCDKHCNKMILESAQLLSTAHRLTNSPYSDKVYKTSHKNHPCAVWVRESTDHYSWLFELYRELTNEFYFRRKKHHASWTNLKDYLCHNPSLPIVGFKDPPQCMPDHCKVPGNTVEAYRTYYNKEKGNIATWNWGREAPEWYNK